MRRIPHIIVPDTASFCLQSHHDMLYEQDTGHSIEEARP
ncbi:MAG TPA: hypothetical protein DEF41_03645 [Desulfovibrio sp.]|uniref:Uncharacterized protein n=1 Tax=Nitratidesulfovibrio vulgaris (strain ATCC 29579 / DSM 644 / CCUG 34227 / NCIMB 8303 / VKM B-1760 / Hildenborough) TaxID=882 RepID=Q72DG7_NITV2|nr:hypothetical protein DVU_0962 [Nitratidesulfovibrio vulgaris str. Hildenborough]HBW15237.1 hypothetical protein [Desulfovibrio sp.]